MPYCGGEVSTSLQSTAVGTDGRLHAEAGTDTDDEEEQDNGVEAVCRSSSVRETRDRACAYQAEACCCGR